MDEAREGEVPAERVDEPRRMPRDAAEHLRHDPVLLVLRHVRGDVRWNSREVGRLVVSVVVVSDVIDEDVDHCQVRDNDDSHETEKYNNGAAHTTGSTDPFQLMQKHQKHHGHFSIRPQRYADGTREVGRVVVEKDAGVEIFIEAKDDVRIWRVVGHREGQQSTEAKRAKEGKQDEPRQMPVPKQQKYALRMYNSTKGTQKYNQGDGHKRRYRKRK